MEAIKRKFGTTEDGRDVYAFLLKNDNGAECEIIEFGASIRTLKVPDRNGKLTDVVLGQDDLENAVKNGAYNAIFVGRHANRIAHGRFKIDGKEYRMETVNDRTVCHCGRGNYGRRFFHGDAYCYQDKAVAVLSLHENGEGGLPGSADASVCYTFTNNNELLIDYTIRCTEPSPVNPTNHAFFNLSGHGKGDLEGHMLKAECDFYCPTDRGGLPTGEILKVDGTPFDFREEADVYDRLAHMDENEQLSMSKGYDHNLCIRERGYREAIDCYSKLTGIRLVVSTDMPGVQVYTATWPSRTCGKDGANYRESGSICFETQFYPNASGYSHFPSCIFYPGETMTSRTSFRFYADR